MKEKIKTKTRHQKSEIEEDESLTGYPSYPPAEDIYGNFQKERDISPEDPSKNKRITGKTGSKNEKDFSDDLTGDDLDVPGSELDDEMEETGNEDEENNYYSLGGDRHNDLDEDNGDY